MGERVASGASRVRGSPQNTIVRNYMGHHTSKPLFPELSSPNLLREE
ncbi:hypothetical protein SBA2_440014 [Acidobacteriia bacterium SbA2]|nr:hypothetical protein SBA2_440014 [Acidobacteriia bacterium SbA2]